MFGRILIKVTGMQKQLNIYDNEQVFLDNVKENFLGKLDDDHMYLLGMGSHVYMIYVETYT
jgi:hypothetical protein